MSSRLHRGTECRKLSHLNDAETSADRPSIPVNLKQVYLSPTFATPGPHNGFYGMSFGLDEHNIISTLSFARAAGMAQTIYPDSHQLTVMVGVVTFQEWMTGYKVVDNQSVTHPRVPVPSSH